MGRKKQRFVRLLIVLDLAQIVASLLFFGANVSTAQDQNTLLPWLDAAVVARFNHSKCKETSTWQQILGKFQSGSTIFSTGGLGALQTDEYAVWACWRNHSCLSVIQSASQTDSMCYVYHETLDAWLPWALKRDVPYCSKTSNASSTGISSTVAAVSGSVVNLLQTCGRSGTYMCTATQSNMHGTGALMAVDGKLTNVAEVGTGYAWDPVGAVPNAWWRGDFFGVSTVVSVNVYPANYIQPGRYEPRAGVVWQTKVLSIYVGNHPTDYTQNSICAANLNASALNVTNVPSAPDAINLNFLPQKVSIPCIQPVNGRYIHLVAPGSATVLSMAEVEAYGWRVESAAVPPITCSAGYRYNQSTAGCERCPAGWTTEQFNAVRL
jgi:hypothetical protein